MDTENTLALQGVLAPDTYFRTFAGRTTQKITHGLLVEKLLVVLGERNIILIPGKPVNFRSIGSGDGTALLEQVRAINRIHKAGVNIDASDGNATFVEQTRMALEHAKAAGENIRDITVYQASAFPERGGTSLRPLADIFQEAGHVMYWALLANRDIPGGLPLAERKTLAVRNALERFGRGLGKDGICMMTHNSPACQLAGIRTKYASDALITEPPLQIREAAASAGIELVAFESTAKLFVPVSRLSPAQIVDAKDVVRYGKAAMRDANFVEFLKLAMFISQRGLADLQREGRLEALIDDLATAARGRA
jgi:hypothetical protein